MTPSDVGEAMNSLWASANRESDDLKDPFIAMERISGLYRALGPSERAIADQVLAEWVLSDDEAKRFDALALVRELGVTKAAPALRALIDSLESRDDPGAAFEREKVDTVLSELGTEGTASV
jgi:hypothetical protein